MRTIRINSFSIAVVGVLAVMTFLLAAESNPPGQAIWPPPRSRVLNVFEEADLPGLQIPAGTYVEVLAVPADSWLTITGASAVNQVGDGVTSLRWVQVDSNGVITRKGRVAYGTLNPSFLAGSPEATPLAGGGPIGWTFEPGSKVGLLNVGSSAAQVTMRSLLGYYSRL